MWPRPLADEAETAQAQVEQDKGVDGDADPVLDDAAAAQDADAGSEGPAYQHQVNGNARDDGNANGRQHRGDDKGEQCVADYGDGLEERAVQ